MRSFMELGVQVGQAAIMMYPRIVQQPCLQQRSSATAIDAIKHLRSASPALRPFDARNLHGLSPQRKLCGDQRPEFRWIVTDRLDAEIGQALDEVWILDGT